jgi:hypothetical protein
MKKPNIKKLKYPLWFNLLFLGLTVVLPLIFVVVQGFKSPSTTFKISFTVICATILIWVFTKKFILSKIEDKIVNKKAAIEHDYELNIGSSENAKWLWFNNELILTIINAIQVLLIGGLIVLFAVGIETAAIKIKTLSILLSLLYTIAYIIKFVLILKLRGEDSEVEDEQSGTK